jgi:ribosomal protein L37AE/L43A
MLPVPIGKKGKRRYLMHCPKCDSQNVRAISKIQANDRDKNNDDFCKGFLCGGLTCYLCGPCSRVSGKLTSAFLWICNNCGCKFR